MQGQSIPKNKTVNLQQVYAEYTTIPKQYAKQRINVDESLFALKYIHMDHPIPPPNTMIVKRLVGIKEKIEKDPIPDLLLHPTDKYYLERINPILACYV